MTDFSSLELLAAIDAPATMDSWELFNDFVEQKAEELLGSSKASYQLRLACEELFSNIIRHASCSDSSTNCAHLWIRALRVLHPKPTLVIELEDNGQAFDPHFEEGREIDTAQGIEHRPIGGLGLFLVQSSVDHVEYKRVAEHNLYRLFVELNDPS